MPSLGRSCDARMPEQGVCNARALKAQASGKKCCNLVRKRTDGMETMKIVYWQEGEYWLGYLQNYPAYWTQGESLDDLKSHLRDLYADLSSGKIPGA